MSIFSVNVPLLHNKIDKLREDTSDYQLTKSLICCALSFNEFNLNVEKLPHGIAGL